MSTLRMISSLLFSCVSLSLVAILILSARQRSHLFDWLVYACARVSIDHVIVHSSFRRFSSHICFGNSVLFSYLLVLKGRKMVRVAVFEGLLSLIEKETSN